MVELRIDWEVRSCGFVVWNGTDGIGGWESQMGDDLDLGWAFTLQVKTDSAVGNIFMWWNMDNLSCDWYLGSVSPKWSTPNDGIECESCSAAIGPTKLLAW